MSLVLEAIGSYPCVAKKHGIDFLRIGETGKGLVESQGESGQKIYIGLTREGVGVYESETMGRGKYKFIMESTCSPRGLLQVNLKTRRNGMVFPDLFAREFITSTIEHYEANGLMVQSWLAWWVPGSVNYSEFWRNHKFGKGVEESAQKTWTGQLASKLGFGNIRPAYVTDKVVQLEFSKS